eukprot:c25233_g1_i2 orf=151-1719(-)
MAGVDEYPHALVVPASGQGHVNGCMLLAQSLTAMGFKVTFIYFSSYYAQMKEKKRLAVLTSLPTEEGPDPSTTSGHGSSNSGGSKGGDLSSQQSPSVDRGSLRIHVLEDGFAPGDIDKLFHVTPAMKENLFNFILELQEQRVPPTCLISDSFIPWTLDVAKRAGIPRVDYWTSNARAYLLLINLPSLLSQGIFPEKGSPTQWKRETPLMVNHIPGLPPISSELWPQHIRFADPTNPFVLFFEEISSCVKSAERILIHTMSELEPDAFAAFQVAGTPTYAIGPLLHNTERQEDSLASSQEKEKSCLPGVSQGKEQQNCVSWLNTQAVASVIYVAFGSHASLSVEETQELAMGLEASGSPFLWVIREDSHGGVELPQVLPDGFLKRTSAKGLIISWAPQVEVLAHKAIGGFLTHCGWNSTFESMCAGIPMLCCPRVAEQRSNSQYICDVWGVGLELGRTDTGGIERGFVEVGVKALMQDEEGLQARGKAQEVMNLARKTCQQGGQSFTNLQKFYDDMKLLCSKP